MKELWRGLSQIVLVVAYSLIVLAVQTFWISGFGWKPLRVDAFIPLAVQVASQWSMPVAGAWALAVGYVMDLLSGRFWGFHVASYGVAVLVHSWAVRCFDMNSFFYRWGCVAVSSAVQSAMLGSWLMVPATVAGAELARLWTDMALRTVFTSLSAPIIMIPAARLWQRAQ